MRKLLLVSALIISLTGTVSGQTLSEIQANNDRFIDALGNGDFETVAQMYTENARVYPPGAEMVQGREAIKAFWASAAAGVSEVSLTVLDLKPLADRFARESGMLMLKTKGDNPKEIAGKYIVIWEKVGDQWKLSDDIWNTNK
jgi:ketosteroid isomerase-like protein